MASSVGKSLSISYFIGAALLAVFGFAARQETPSDGAIQIALGVAMLGAGLFLRGGTAQAWLVGLGAAVCVCLYGAFDLFTGHGYVPGTIVAVFAFARLMGAQAHFGPSAVAVGQPTPYGAPYGAPTPYPQQAYPQPAYPQQVYPQPAYPQPVYPQPAAPPLPAPWSPPAGGPAPAPAPAQPPAPVVQPPSDSRFG